MESTLHRMSLKPDQLKPNSYNPNRQTDEEFAENVAEVRRLGRLPKPVIVRCASDGGYEIIDGEHGWRAAKEVGLAEVPCEILEASDFEAMLLTYKRNRTGSDNPVLLGRMFEQMQADCKLSGRRFAAKIDVPEATVRSYLCYAEASALRAKYNSNDCIEAVAEMTHREVQAYLDLGDDLRDKWFDAGHELRKLDGLFEASPHQLRLPISESGLGYVVESSYKRFRPSLEFALALAAWSEEHKAVQGVDDYIRPVSELRIGDDRDFPPVELPNLLPCHREDGCATVALPADKWASILCDAAGRAADEDGLVALVEKGVRVALKQAGVDPGEVLGPDVAEAMQILSNAPACIREADMLTLDEQAWLATVEVKAADDVVATAKELACDYIQRQRSGSGNNHDDYIDGGIDDVLRHFVDRLLHERDESVLDKFFADREQLIATTLVKFAECRSSKVVVGDQLASNLLASRLRALPDPELALLAASVLQLPRLDDAAARWLAALNR